MQIYIVNKSQISSRLSVNMCKHMGFENVTVVPDYKILSEIFWGYANTEQMIIFCAKIIFMHET